MLIAAPPTGVGDLVWSKLELGRSMLYVKNRYLCTGQFDMSMSH